MILDRAINNGTEYTSREWIAEMTAWETAGEPDDYLPMVAIAFASPPGPRPPPQVAEAHADSQSRPMEALDRALLINLIKIIGGE